MMLPSLAAKWAPTVQRVKRQLGKGDPATLWVRVGRITYSGTAAAIILAWYSGWRNQRTTPGEYVFPFPGLTKRKASGSIDRPDKEAIDVAALLDKAGASVLQAGVAIGSPVAAAVGAGIQGAGDLTGRAGIVKVGHLFQKLGYNVGEHPQFGGVHPVHVAGSLHNAGRAIDITSKKGIAPGSKAATADLDAGANMLVNQFGAGAFTEIIWNGPHPVAVKNGAMVDGATVFGDVWDKHKNHIHVGI